MHFDRSSNRGFSTVTHPTYGRETPTMTRILGRSSAIGDYKDSFDRPGSSFLWIGEEHHLNREEVAEFSRYILNWLKTGELSQEKPEDKETPK